MNAESTGRFRGTPLFCLAVLIVPRLPLNSARKAISPLAATLFMAAAATLFSIFIYLWSTRVINP